MKTISEHPLLIGRLLARAEARQARRGNRARRLQRAVEVATERVLLPAVAVLSVAVIGAMMWSLLIGVVALF